MRYCVIDLEAWAAAARTAAGHVPRTRQKREFRTAGQRIYRPASPQNPREKQTGLAAGVAVGYAAGMSFLLRTITRYAAQRLAANPRVREKAARAAQAAIDEGKRIAREENRAYAAGQAVRRTLNKLRGDR
jgi:hypothetical protein